MEITNKEQSGVVIATLVGDVDGKSAGPTQQQLLPLIPSQGKMLLDMSGVEYMSSAGLRMLLLVYRQVQSKGSKIALVGLNTDISDTMSATGFLDYFVLSESVSAGIEALGDE
jgi:anti-sigma B factor antagonist